MDLSKKLAAAGIGCGEDCGCAMGFVATLNDIQQMALNHMIEQGAQTRFKAIMEAGSKKNNDGDNSTSSDFLDQLSEEALGDNGREQLDLFDRLNNAMMRASGIDPETSPYEGELGDELVKILDQIPEDQREDFERRLRQIIATKADNDPTRIVVELDKYGLSISMRKNEDIAAE